MASVASLLASTCSGSPPLRVTEREGRRRPAGLGERGAQALVALDDVAQRGVERGPVAAGGQAQRERDVVPRAGLVLALQRPQPPLGEGRRQRVRVLQRPQRRAAGAAAVEAAGERGDGRRLEQVADRQLGAEPRADAAEQAHAEQRVAAEGEEVVLRTDLRQPEQLGEELGEDVLLRRRGAREPAASAPRSGAGSAARSSLPLGVERQLGERDDRRRHHVIRQRRGGVAAQRGRVELGAVRRDGVRDEPRRPGSSSRSSATARATAGWRASTASISAGSMRKPRSLTWSSARPRKSSAPSARQRARSPVRYIRSPARERVGDEALGGQVGPAEVAAREPVAGDVELPARAGRQRAQGRSRTYARVFGSGGRSGRARRPSRARHARASS